jgi:hypothetical protein
MMRGNIYIFLAKNLEIDFEQNKKGFPWMAFPLL